MCRGSKASKHQAKGRKSAFAGVSSDVLSLSLSLSPSALVERKRMAHMTLVENTGPWDIP